jgi:hypothetical protein
METLKTGGKQPTLGLIKNKLLMNCYVEHRTWTASLNKWHKLQNMDMRFSTWNMRSLYRVGLLMIFEKEYQNIS